MAPPAPQWTTPLLSKSQGGGNKQGGGAKLVKSINVEEGINDNSLQKLQNQQGGEKNIKEMRVRLYVSPTEGT